MTRPSPGLGGNRPGIGGERPSIGMTKPAPGFEQPVGLPGSRPERPGVGGNRPGAGWNRPGIGGNNAFWNNNWNSGNVINNINNHNNWFTNNNFTNVNINRPGYGWNGGGWGLPGYGAGWHGGGGHGGYGNWGNQWYNRCVNPGYARWYHGCWNGNWNGYNGGWWAPLVFGAATWGLASTCANWGLGYSCLGYGAGGYVNPYYASIPATVVAASPYDYSQPIIVNNYVGKDGEAAGAGAVADESGTTAGEAAKPKADPVVDKALADFKNGEYDAAVAGLDRAVKASPKDSVLHEVRALSLFALGRYDEAAAALNAVLAVAPGMDWTTMSGLYGSVDDYTTQLRRLEAFCKANPGNAAGYFVLAYHYLVGGHADLAADALEVVVAKQPGDAVAKRLLDAITPPSEAADSKDGKPPAAAEPVKPAAAEVGDDSSGTNAAGPETDLVGTWKATMGDDAVELSVKDDFTFTWKATPKGQPAVELSGRISTTADAVALESDKAGTMLAKVKSLGTDSFEFSLVGAPKDAKPLVFQRQE